MKFGKYIKDKGLEIFWFCLSYFFILLMLLAFKVNGEVLLGISVVFVLLFFSLLLTGYLKGINFYTSLIQNVKGLDKKYLVLEMLNKPNFYDGELFYEILYEINKSMNETIKQYEYSLDDFKEYVELWIHEIKLPIASLTLMEHNQKGKMVERYAEQVRRIDDYVDQILYFVRSENAEKDYLIKETNLQQVIKQVALKNKDDLLAHDIQFIVDVQDEVVLTDAKWLEFIINQIVSNSIKYVRSDVSSVIKFTVSKTKTQTSLHIYDNGIGIPLNDIHRVFEKTFTGENGRKRGKSTGMGLYIVKRLCEKLGHKITLSSVVNQYTEVVLTFALNDFYKMKD